MLDAAGFEQIPVYRVAAEPIGCSLAESAETPAYGRTSRGRASSEARAARRLHQHQPRHQGQGPRAGAHDHLHQLERGATRAAAFAQVPDGHVFFGPDTYMGHNLAHLFETLAASRTTPRSRGAPGPHARERAVALGALSLLRAGHLHRAPHVRRRGGAGGASRATPTPGHGAPRGARRDVRARPRGQQRGARRGGLDLDILTFIGEAARGVDRGAARRRRSRSCSAPRRG
jgi:hypothetical protein